MLVETCPEMKASAEIKICFDRESNQGPFH